MVVVVEERNVGEHGHPQSHLSVAVVCTCTNRQVRSWLGRLNDGLGESVLWKACRLVDR